MIPLGFWMLHPALVVLGIGAASLPILVHLWNRRRPREMRWAAMAFLTSAYRRTSRRVRLEQFLLLAARVGVILLITLALSRPFVGTWLRAEQPENIIVLLDNSRSMNHLLPTGQSALDRARNVAFELIRANPAGRYAVIALAEPATIQQPATTSGGESVRIIAHMPPTSRQPDLVGGLGLAARLARDWKTSPESCRTILLSSLTTGGWSALESSAQADLAEAAVRLQKHSGIELGRICAPSPQNAAITALKPLDRLITAHWPAGFELQLANFTERELSDLAVDVFVDRRLTQTLHVDRLAPGHTVSRVFEQSVPAAGFHNLQAELRSVPGDVLPEDDRRPLVIEVADRVSVLIVTGPNGGSPNPEYVAAALGLVHPDVAAGGQTAASLFAGKVIPASVLPQEPLGDCELVVLQDVPSLPAEQWRRLRAFVSAGRGLLVFPGPNTRLEHYNAHTIASGAGPLPARLSESRLATGAQPVTFARAASSHPALVELAGSPGTGFYQARVFRHLETQDLAPHASAPLRYSDGSAALVDAPLDAGRVILCTTAAEITWTNLPARGDFVSLMLGLGQYLACDRSSRCNLSAAGPVRIPLTPAESRGRVVLNGPALPPTPMIIELAGSGDSAGESEWQAVCTGAGLQGIYEAHVVASGRMVPVARQGAAAASDLNPVPDQAIQQRLGDSTLADLGSQPLPPHAMPAGSELSTLLLGLAGVLLLLETWLAASIDQGAFREPLDGITAASMHRERRLVSAAAEGDR